MGRPEAIRAAAHEDVLVVIPCLNEEAHLPVLLDRLLTDACGETIVVADGGSTDGSRELVIERARRYPRLHLIDNPDRIQSAGVNLAARRFGEGRRWLVRIDAHCDYPEGYVRTLLSVASMRRATSVVVPMVSRGRDCLQRAAAEAQNSVLGTGGSAHRHLGQGQWVEHGHHALFDMALFCQVGGYDEQFAANEDAELDRRLLSASGRIWLEPGAAITYYPRRTLPALFRQYRAYGTGRARNLRRHPDRMRLRQALPLVVAPAMALNLAGLALAMWQPLALWLTSPALFWLLMAFAVGVVLGLRRRSRCACAAGLAAAIMHLAWSIGFLQEMLARPAMPPVPTRLAFAGDAAPPHPSAGSERNEPSVPRRPAAPGRAIVWPGAAMAAGGDLLEEPAG